MIAGWLAPRTNCNYQCININVKIEHFSSAHGTLIVCPCMTSFVIWCAKIDLMVWIFYFCSVSFDNIDQGLSITLLFSLALFHSYNLWRCCLLITGVAVICIEGSEGGRRIQENYPCYHCALPAIQEQLNKQHLDCFALYPKEDWS